MDTFSTLFLAIGCSVPFLSHAQFGAGVPIASGVTDVQEIRSANLDGDDDLDLIVRQPSAIGWFENDGAGNFAPFDTIHVSQGELGAFDLADTQGDGGTDLVVTDLGADSILLLVNGGSGSFGVPLAVVGLDGASVFALVLADIFGDPLPEVVYKTGMIINGLENEAGNFGGAQLLTGSSFPHRGLHIWDIDGDDLRDLVHFVGLSSAFKINLNPGILGEPWEAIPFTFGHFMGGKPLRLLDVDGDGDLDLADAANHRMQWLEFQADAPAPHTVGGGSVADISLNRTGWTARLGCGLGASMLWTDSIGEPVQWATYDTVLDGFGPVSVLPNLPSFQAIHSGDLDGDGREDLILWHTDSIISWYRNILEPPQIMPFDTSCAGVTHMLLENAVTPGGSWSGFGVENNVFTSGEAGAYMLYYAVVDTLSGCPVTASQVMEVDLCTNLEGSGLETRTLTIHPSVTSSGPIYFESTVAVPLQFIDASGRLVLTISNVQPGSPIDVSSLQRGLYTVIALANGERRVGRVVIE